MRISWYARPEARIRPVAAGFVRQLADAEADGAGEAAPPLVVLELALDALALAGRQEQHDHEQRERGAWP